MALGLLLEVAGAVCLVIGGRWGALRASAPDRHSAALPPWRGWLLYSLGGGLATGGVAVLREDLGWWGLALGLVVLFATSGLLKFTRRRGPGPPPGLGVSSAPARRRRR